MDIIQIILQTMVAAARSVENGDPGALRIRFTALLDYLNRRYPTLGVQATTETFLALAEEVDFSRALRRVGAESDDQLLKHTVALQQEMQQIPADLAETIGVNLDNVKADSIRISGIYINGAPETAEPVAQRTVYAYLKALVGDTPGQADAGSGEGIDKMRDRLETTPFYVHRPGDIQDSRIDVAQAIEKNFHLDRELGRIERVILLADSGVGKTRALNYIRRTIAAKGVGFCSQVFSDDENDNPSADRSPETEIEAEEFTSSVTIPIYVNLANLQSGLPLRTLLRDEFNRYVAQTDLDERLGLEQIPELLRCHSCLFLLDSMDAIASNPAQLQHLRQFMEENRDEQFVITCRTVNYRTQLGSIDVVELDNLTPDEAMEVLTPAIYARLHHALGSLVHNRLMLKMILTLHEADELADNMTNKGQLIRSYVRERLKRSLPQQSAGGLDQEAAEALLEHLAYRMYRAHTYNVSERTLRDEIKIFLEEWYESASWRRVLRQLSDSKFLQRDDRRMWHISDRTSAAYLAAAAMVEDKSLLTPVLMEASDLWWREVLEVYAGLAHEPKKLFFEMMDQDVLMAAHCAQYRTLSMRVTNALIDALIERMRHEDVEARVRIALRLGESGHPRAAEALIRALHQERASIVVLAIAQAIWQWSRRRSFNELLRVEEKVIAEAPAALEEFGELLLTYERMAVARGKFRARYEQQLLSRIDDTDASRLSRGLCAIGLGFTDSERAYQKLIDLLDSDDNDAFVAWCATDTLAHNRRLDVELHAVKIFRSKEHSDCTCRARATYLLGWVCRTAVSRDLLRDEALQDEDPDVRTNAVDSLVRLDLPDARAAIEKRLNAETNTKVIRKCAAALSRIGTPASLPALERHRYTEKARARWQVVNAINEINTRFALADV